jgi:NAD(P)-dependent dehydrogenase (short-subunit alcohol dehydrogenase family)
VTETRPVEEATFDDIVSRGVVRFFGPLLLAKHARAHMRSDAASSITLTGASTSDMPLENYAVEAGHASGLEGMARSLSIDLAPIRVNVIKPGVVRTEIFDRIPKDYLDPVLAKMTARTTTNEVGEPQDVAEAYLHAMKDRYFVGQSVSVDGGLGLK